MKEKKLLKLTTTQDHTLKLLYKFRFVTTHTLANYKQQSDIKSSYKLLEKLKNQGYVIKHYDKLAKIDRKSAIYSLSKEGIRYLRDKYTLSKSALHAMYKNRSTSEAYAEQYIDVFKVCNSIRNSYPDQFDIFTKTELNDQVYFPDPRPDLYLRRREETAGPREFMLLMVNDVQLFVIKKRLKPVLEHYEKEGWDGDYPTVLMVLPTSSVETRVREYLDNLDLDDELKVLLTTRKALLDASNSEIWTDYRTEEMNLRLS